MNEGLNQLQQRLRIGTARAGRASSVMAAPLDALLPAVDAAAPQADLWLGLAALDLWERSGFVASDPGALPASEPAPAERLRPCPPNAEAALVLLLHGSHSSALLPQWLRHLQAYGGRLPERFLPKLLEMATRQGVLRPGLLPVLGERGRWLATRQPDWRWACADNTDDVRAWEPARSSSASTPYARGARDPAYAREQLAAAWKSEPPEHRAVLLPQLATGLGLADEAFADPLRWLAQAAGYSDTDTWWDHLVEQRSDSLDLFAAIAEMMGALREHAGAPSDPLELQREAYMRGAIRQAVKSGRERIAVVCGAWHVPALATLPSAKSDADLLKGLPKEKVAATWVPWSHGRLTFASGYGAGVVAPGWYRHLWCHRDRAALYWLTEVATLLRKNDLDASSAHVIEAARLAALRERPRPGLAELMEAVRTVFCYDSDAPLRLIRRELLIDESLGEVPPDVASVPLAQDVLAQQKRLRMAVRADATELDLDLRQPAHLDKSILLHRLALLGIDWGKQLAVRGKTGTFHEQWRLVWQPEFAVDLVEASCWGGTLESAAGAFATDRAHRGGRHVDAGSRVAVGVAARAGQRTALRQRAQGRHRRVVQRGRRLDRARLHRAALWTARTRRRGGRRGSQAADRYGPGDPAAAIGRSPCGLVRGIGRRRDQRAVPSAADPAYDSWNPRDGDIDA